MTTINTANANPLTSYSASTSMTGTSEAASQSVTLTSSTDYQDLLNVSSLAGLDAPTSITDTAALFGEVSDDLRQLLSKIDINSQDDSDAAVLAALLRIAADYALLQTSLSADSRSESQYNVDVATVSSDNNQISVDLHAIAGLQADIASASSQPGGGTAEIQADQAGIQTLENEIGSSTQVGSLTYDVTAAIADESTQQANIANNKSIELSTIADIGQQETLAAAALQSNSSGSTTSASTAAALSNLANDIAVVANNTIDANASTAFLDKLRGNNLDPVTEAAVALFQGLAAILASLAQLGIGASQTGTSSPQTLSASAVVA